MRSKKFSGPLTLSALVLAVTTVTAGMVQASAIRYALEPQQSNVGFQASFGGGGLTGAMPVKSANVTLDFASLANCTINVVLDVTNATANFPFATMVMKSSDVLDAARYQTISFTSTAVRSSGDGAEVDGMITLHGVTRPITLSAQLYRQTAVKPGDLSKIEVLLTGTVKRSQFGADGWGMLVGDAVHLHILAALSKAG
ncbi:protein YceI [mine drainage metagenome]|uniref:Protein YceI n=1 Tax=mine drainage metagenome TaxID=410659 RepID=A0A1J5RWP7_9ZZZZ